MSNAIEKIYQFNRFGSRLGLERMTMLLEKLGNPHRELAVIHVAGTNGKGSVCKFLEEGLAACGYQVGLYTSPFIERFHERIRLGGCDISDADLEQSAARVLAAADEMVAEGHDSPTEFEVVTAIAFLYFREKGAEITVLEVGLGGRGDSTNVIEKPLACAITSISYDHMDRLGNTLAEIAAEKAGIIKPGVPVVANVPEREAAAVIARTAYDRGSRLFDISKINFSVDAATPFSQEISMELYGTDYSGVTISMAGRHQGENLKTALAVIEILRKERKIKVERTALYRGLKRAVQPGRFEVIDAKGLNPKALDQFEKTSVDRVEITDASWFEAAETGRVAPAGAGKLVAFEPKGRALTQEDSGSAGAERTGKLLAANGSLKDGSHRRPLVILDGAHNEAGACALHETMERFFPGKRVLLVLGMLADKQADDMLAHFTKITGDMIVTEPDNPRRLSADELEKLLRQRGITPVKAVDAAESTRLVRKLGACYDVVLFAGSLYLIGEIRRILRNEQGKGCE